MPATPTPGGDCSPLYRALLWDLAGTLLVRDGSNWRTGPLPGWREVLPRLARDWRMAVATGEESRSARSLLAESGMLPHFEEVYGDLPGYGGKPHGEILREMGARPACSLAIGDRLGGDLPADTDELVLLLVGTRDAPTRAGLIEEVVGRLTAAAPTCLEAFRTLVRGGKPHPASIGTVGHGAVTAAWTCAELPEAELWIFEPDWMDARRPVIVV